MRGVSDLVFAILEAAIVTCLRLPGALWRILIGAIDFLSARYRMRGGALHCPDGHVIPLEGVFECSSCGFRYRGSGLVCGNVECRAHTPYVNCSCGLSVRNPYRWGRP
jgi:hypothetical protein